MGYFNTGSIVIPATVVGGAINLGSDIGSEIVTNGGFDSETSGWSATDCTLASVAGGQSGNCLEITRTGGGGQSARQGEFIATGDNYHISFYVKSGSSGDEAFVVYDDVGVVYGFISGTSSALWVKYEKIFVSTAPSIGIILKKDSGTAGTMLFDAVSLYKQAPLYTRPKTTITLTAETTAADDLDYIWGGITGQRIILKGLGTGSSAVTYPVTVKNSTAKGMFLQADFTLVYPNSCMELECISLNNWREISRAQVTA